MKLQHCLFGEARSSGLLFPLAVLAAFVAGGLAIYQSFVLSRVISGVFLEAKTLAQVKPLLQVILLVVLARAVFTYINEVLAGRLAVAIKTRLRRQMLEKIDRLGPEYLKNETTAGLTTTALLGIDALDAYFSQFLPQVLIAALLPLTILVVVFPLDLLTGGVFLVTAPIIPVFMALIGKAVESLTGKQWKALSRLGNYLLDTLQGITTLKLLGRNKERVVEIWKASDDYHDTTMNVLRVTFLTALVLELVATISTALVAVEIGLRLLYARIEFQQAFFILLITPDFYLPLRNLSARYHAGMGGVTAAEKIYKVLNEPEPGERVAKITTDLSRRLQGDFKLQIYNLSQIYPGQQDKALTDISFDIEKGKHYVLVGKSGAGKSTLARILMRFIQPTAGEILIDGEDFRSWSREDWHRSVGWLPQSPHIFNASLLFNITLGEDRFSSSKIESAVKTAGLHELLNQLPHGLETPLLESGVRLSGGELQRIALARVYLRDPQIVLLDEPTAYLDPELTRKLEASYKYLMAGRTSLTIAHRLSTVLSADEVLFMHTGHLVARGKHSELLISSPAYREFIQGAGAGL